MMNRRARIKGIANIPIRRKTEIKNETENSPEKVEDIINQEISVNSATEEVKTYIKEPTEEISDKNVWTSKPKPILEMLSILRRSKPVFSPEKDPIEETPESIKSPEPLSPNKSLNRSRIKVTPKLIRRNSVQGSASESEDDFKKCRIRNDSVCSTNSFTAEIVEKNCVVSKDKIISIKVHKLFRRSEQSRKLAEARKDFQQKFGNKIPDRKKLTMIDLIYYNPSTNPMPQKRKEESPIEIPLRPPSRTETEEEQVDDPTEDSNPVPQVKIGPDGEIVLDEQSLVVEQTGIKKGREKLAASQIVTLDDTDRVYGVYKRPKRSKIWSANETLRFYRSLNTVGTDFSLMVGLFPGRSRAELKKKFKKEEKINRQLIDKALTNPQEFNLAELEQQLAEEQEIPIIVKEKRKKYKKTSASAMEIGETEEIQEKPKKQTVLRPRKTKKIDRYSALNLKDINTTSESSSDESDNFELKKFKYGSDSEEIDQKNDKNSNLVKKSRKLPDYSSEVEERDKKCKSEPDVEVNNKKRKSGSVLERINRKNSNLSEKLQNLNEYGSDLEESYEKDDSGSDWEEINLNLPKKLKLNKKKCKSGSELNEINLTNNKNLNLGESLLEYGSDIKEIDKLNKSNSELEKNNKNLNLNENLLEYGSELEENDKKHKSVSDLEEINLENNKNSNLVERSQNLTENLLEYTSDVEKTDKIHKSDLELKKNHKKDKFRPDLAKINLRKNKIPKLIKRSQNKTENLLESGSEFEESDKKYKSVADLKEINLKNNQNSNLVERSQIINENLLESGSDFEESERKYKSGSDLEETDEKRKSGSDLEKISPTNSNLIENLIDYGPDLEKSHKIDNSASDLRKNKLRNNKISKSIKRSQNLSENLFESGSDFEESDKKYKSGSDLEETDKKLKSGSDLEKINPTNSNLIEYGPDLEKINKKNNFFSDLSENDNKNINLIENSQNFDTIHETIEETIEKTEISIQNRPDQNYSLPNILPNDLSTVEPGSLVILSTTDENGQQVFKVFMVTPGQAKVPVNLSEDVVQSLTNSLGDAEAVTLDLPVIHEENV